MPHISQISSFLEDNPSEFVIIQVQRERKLDQAHLNSFINDIIGLFKDKMVTRTDPNTYWDISTKTIGEISSSKKQVWFLCDEKLLMNDFIPSNQSKQLLGYSITPEEEKERNDSLEGSCLYEKYGFFNAETYMDNKWHRARNRKQLFKANLEYISTRDSNMLAVCSLNNSLEDDQDQQQDEIELEQEDTTNKKSSDKEKETDQPQRLTNSQMTLTPMVGAGPTQLFAVPLGIEPVRVDNLTQRLVKKQYMSYFMRDNCECQWNSVWFDFIEFLPYLINFLIGLNYPHTLKIVKALIIYHDTKYGVGRVQFDVTAKIKQLVQRGNTCYLVNIKKDLELEVWGGGLMVVYEYEGKGQAVSKCRILKKGQFLLNYETYRDFDYRLGSQVENIDEDRLIKGEDIGRVSLDTLCNLEYCQEPAEVSKSGISKRIEIEEVEINEKKGLDLKDSLLKDHTNLNNRV